jgi:hypothetical protein
MHHAVTPSLKWAYVIVVLTAVSPFGLSHSGWVAMATGGGVLGGVPVLGPLVLLVVGVYRAYLVVKVPGTLESYPVAGFALGLRRIGVVALYVGAVMGLLDVLAGPLMMVLVRGRSQAGVGLFAAGLYLSILGRVGILALVLFELSRLVGFERQRQAQPDVADTVIQS